MLEIYPKLKETDWQVLHVTGKQGFSNIARQVKDLGIKKLDEGNIRIKSYLYNMEAALQAADLIISRAGATILAEITVCGIPAVLIPYPYAAENHQEYNARSLEKSGAAQVILDQELNREKLWKTVKDIINSQQLLQMKKESKKLGQPKAADKIIDLILSLTNGT
jgi:UDP-N-acetylglucosamine--N-acetylmuramyl-(pentapeptide) pyrophosphoryl-undecaprenol N-acetylglucosamine transferase